jgi:hypothetical protein
MRRAIAMLFLTAAAASGACMSALPGGTVTEPTGGRGGSAGRGGAPGGTGGTLSTGGMSGRATGGGPGPGAGGAGGMGTNPSLSCSGVPLAIAGVTDFDDALGSNPIRFGVPPALTGRTFARPGPGGSAAPMVSLVAGDNATNALQVDSPLQQGFFDAGLTFDTVADAHLYSHVRFTIHFLSNCSLGFAVVSPQGVSAADDPRGTCAPTSTQTSCPLPFTNISQNGVLCAPIAGFPAGPNADATSVIGLVWRTNADCAFTIDDVAFVKQ